MKKILTIIGARPQFVKAAVLSKSFAELAGDVLQEMILHTGQHYDDAMSDLFFRELSIPTPYKNLAIGSESHGQQTAKMLVAIESEIQVIKPDIVLIYGDTNSTLAGALAAVKLRVPVAHVEAGMRSFNRRMPEEINRIVADQCSDILYTPSSIATENLLAEGYAKDTIIEVGDVMFDAFLLYRSLNHSNELLRNKYKLDPNQYVLATVHRAENTDDPVRLRAVIEGLSAVANSIPVLLPLHPRTRATLQKSGQLSALEKKVTIIDPVGYGEMTALTAGALVVATDSGGLQKEAYYAGVPCVTLRDETEWVELVQQGFNVIVSPDRGASEIAETICLRAKQPKLLIEKDLYGGGRAVVQLVEHLKGYLTETSSVLRNRN